MTLGPWSMVTSSFESPGQVILDLFHRPVVVVTEMGPSLSPFLVKREGTREVRGVMEVDRFRYRSITVMSVNSTDSGGPVVCHGRSPIVTHTSVFPPFFRVLLVFLKLSYISKFLLTFYFILSVLIGSILQIFSRSLFRVV